MIRMKATTLKTWKKFVSDAIKTKRWVEESLSRPTFVDASGVSQQDDYLNKSLPLALRLKVHKLSHTYL